MIARIRNRAAIIRQDIERAGCSTDRALIYRYSVCAARWEALRLKTDRGLAAPADDRRYHDLSAVLRVLSEKLNLETATDSGESVGGSSVSDESKPNALNTIRLTSARRGAGPSSTVDFLGRNSIRDNDGLCLISAVTARGVTILGMATCPSKWGSREMSRRDDAAATTDDALSARSTPVGLFARWRSLSEPAFRPPTAEPRPAATWTALERALPLPRASPRRGSSVDVDPVGSAHATPALFATATPAPNAIAS